MSDKVFVYGTLRRGFDNHHLIEKYVQSVTAATMRGILYDLGDYPAMLSGDGVIVGEIVTFTDPQHAFRVMDLLEEFDSPGHPSNEYERVIGVATTEEGENVDCQVYIFRDERLEEMQRDYALIENGDWARRSERTEE